MDNVRAIKRLVFVDFSNAFQACVVSTVREAHRRTHTGPWGRTSREGVKRLKTRGAFLAVGGSAEP